MISPNMKISDERVSGLIWQLDCQEKGF